MFSLIKKAKLIKLGFSSSQIEGYGKKRSNDHNSSMLPICTANGSDHNVH